MPRSSNGGGVTYSDSRARPEYIVGARPSRRWAMGEGGKREVIAWPQSRIYSCIVCNNNNNNIVIMQWTIQQLYPVCSTHRRWCWSRAPAYRNAVYARRWPTYNVQQQCGGGGIRRPRQRFNMCDHMDVSQTDRRRRRPPAAARHHTNKRQR